MSYLNTPNKPAKNQSQALWENSHSHPLIKVTKCRTLAALCDSRRTQRDLNDGFITKFVI
jgi:hypothetical protein